ncbi:MAG TPA: selenocysteine-specific translation elongation factor [Coriobacteriia bacterium]|nr:selenocysteine-specific translation elongation factor [Coriobacteriia bacterium]
MGSLVLGTAGHIDHGKSTLVKALTGTDPDRLAEEKARGITIELGFAQLILPSGRTMGVVDVPGHERFVRQMVAGATGIDAVLLVVAADDGVMPQTREHLAIIDLLGVGRGVVALTKADLADPEWIELVAEEVRALVDTTSIAGAPIVPVSAQTGLGIPELLEALDSVAEETPSRQAGLPFRLPVDRVFTIAGAGTVVTGTLWSGQVSRDDPVEVLPGGREARVRGVQVHSAGVDKATAGQRVALNIAGVDRGDISRGDVIAAPRTLSASDRFDALFTYLGTPGENQPFESDTRVHVHHGTREVLGRVLLMDTAALASGQSGLAQVRLEAPLVPRYGDRFIVRSYSPVYTIGGGTVLDVLPPRRTTLREHERELLDALVAHDLSAASTGLLASRALPMTSAEVAAAIGVPRAQVADELNRADLARLKVGGETAFITTGALESLITAVERELRAFHQAEPTATGIATAALRDRVDRRLTPRAFDAVLESATGRGSAVVEKGMVRHPEAAVSALAEERAAEAALRPLVAQDGFAPRTVTAWAAEAGVDPGVARKVLNRMASEGTIVRVSSDLYFDLGAVDAMRRRIVAYLSEQGSAPTSELRDVIGVSRKYVIPLLEHFDAIGLTKFENDRRSLRKPSSRG